MLRLGTIKMTRTMYGIATIFVFLVLLAIGSRFYVAKPGAIQEQAPFQDHSEEVAKDEHLEPDKTKVRNEAPQALTSQHAKFTPEEASAYKGKIEDLLGNETSPRRCGYKRTKQYLDGRCVPLLREMMEDPLYKKRWPGIALMLAWLSDREDEVSWSVFLDYVQRPDFAARNELSDGSKYLAAKVTALKYAGLFEMKETSDFLRKTFTEEGARELVAGWYAVPRAENDAEFREYIIGAQGQAARGLIYSDSPENLLLVEKAYEAMAHRSQRREEQSAKSPQERRDNLKWYYKLVEAMAEKDIIATLGREQLLETLGTESVVQLLGDYTEKYSRDLSEVDIVIIDPCPICGKTGR